MSPGAAIAIIQGYQGMENTSLRASPQAARRHLAYISADGKGLIEIAIDDSEGALNKARLFGADEIDAAVEYAIDQNTAGHNCYVGAAVRRPGANRNKRASDKDYAASSVVWCDIDDGDAAEHALNGGVMNLLMNINVIEIL